MPADLKLVEITGSPNNVKVRIALGYKGLDYVREPFEFEGFPGDRSELVALSTQPRTPVLKHGETVVFDSGAILRYLDANFPDTSRLFSEDYAEMGEIEEWELWARTDLYSHVGTVFGQIFASPPDAAVLRRACEAMHEATGRIEAALERAPFLLGDAMKAADVVSAPMVNLAMISDSAETGPILGFFREHFQLGEGRERTREWVRRVMAYDPLFAG